MIKELKNKSNEELGELIAKMKSKLLEFRFQEASGELEGTHKIKMVKKTIAIAFTLLSERNVKASFSSHDHALITIKDGKRITKSFKPKGSTSIIFEEEKEVSQDSTEKSKNKLTKVKKEKVDVPPIGEKKIVEKKITNIFKKKKNSTTTPSSVIRKSTGRGQ